MPKYFLLKLLILSLAISEANSESNKAKQLTVNYLQVRELDPKFFSFSTQVNKWNSYTK